MVNDIYTLINVSDLKQLITGVIILYRRPKSSNKIDIVVNSLDINNEPLQDGFGNINVHAPSLKNVSFNGNPDDQQPDLTLLNSISKLICDKLDGFWGTDFHCDVEPPQPFQDNDGTWYINIRYNYYTFNNNFKN